MTAPTRPRRPDGPSVPRSSKTVGRPASPVRPKATPARTRRVKTPPLPRSAAYVFLLVVVALLTLLGLVMVLSASSVQALRNHGSSWYFFDRQLVWVALGVGAMFATSRVQYGRWRQVAVPLLGLAMVLMLLVLVPGVGINVGGSSRWLGRGALRMQPSELAKLGLLLFGADLLARRADQIHDWRATLRPIVGFYLGIAVLLLAQPDLGTALVTGCIVLGMLFLAGTPIRWMTVLLAFASGGTLLLAKVEPYRWRRMTSFLKPFADVSNAGYQAAQGRVALASGGLTGVGLGASRAKWGFLPAAHTDFIFAIIGEELGLAGALVVIVLFCAMAYLGARSALRAPDRFGFLLAGGITAWVLGQAVINIGAVVGLLPITGVPLPFVSSGGSSLVPMMAAMGILLNVTRHGRPSPKRPTAAGTGRLRRKASADTGP